MPALQKTDADLKAEEKQAKVEQKILDKDDDMFCGFCQFNVIDQDGYSKMIKGCDVGGVLFVERAGGKVVISSSFTPKPHGYLAIQRDSELFVNGAVWYGESKKSPTNMIGRIIPKQMEGIIKEQEKKEDAKEDHTKFDCKFEMPFLKNSAKRLGVLTFETVEEKFLTKLCGMRLELTEEDWLEWKEYKLRFWKLGKAAGASTEGGDDKKDEEKKEAEEK